MPPKRTKGPETSKNKSSILVAVNIRKKTVSIVEKKKKSSSKRGASTNGKKRTRTKTTPAQSLETSFGKAYLVLKKSYLHYYCSLYNWWDGFARRLWWIID
jgi:hypothetical protein